MKNLPILFALGTALCWGLYGPTLENARSPEKLWGPFKPYLGIGVAYLVWAILGAMIAMRLWGDTLDFTGKQTAAGLWGFAAGSLGALGALSLTSAMVSGGKAHIVMPVVFGGAVSITAITKVILTKSEVQASPWLWAGIAIVVVGIILVASNTPHGGPAHKAQPAASEQGEASASAEEASNQPADG